MQARLQRRLQVLEHIQRDLQIAGEILLGEARRDLRHPLLFAGRRGDQAGVLAHHFRHQQVAEEARQLPAKML